MRKCPHCGSEMYEDAAEDIEITPKELILNSFPAWICENCVYYEKIVEGDEDD
ncbi:hypothetical protein [Alkalihalophilus marmarensis]|uniref:Uncharacterized protein n=1 Tax=Alkalihalophilus marmarensis DSM 21297 TaxID=1188261 RepID=U6SJU6_9BACI|nr:hypothetical protein [Alkalihalophilus marmarensis]ERN51828.1 hypothetical protein A33I_18630 [Alkalihalophilus marmarensis DSM 21297]